MNHSESLKEIAPALVKCQSEIKEAKFDSTNPHFKSKYASLNAIVAASKDALSKNGLSILQTIKRLGDTDVIITRLLHQSGEWIEDEGIPLIIEKNTMQGLGSAYTYARRYGMQSLLRIVADEDDDGGAAEKPQASEKPQKVTQKAPPQLSHHPEEAVPSGGPPSCERCNTPLRYSEKSGAYYCPNFKDKSEGEHSYRKMPKYVESTASDPPHWQDDIHL